MTMHLLLSLNSEAQKTVDNSSPISLTSCVFEEMTHGDFFFAVRFFSANGDAIIDWVSVHWVLHQEGRQLVDEDIAIIRI